MRDFIHEFNGKSYNDLVKYKSEQIDYIILPDINLSENSVFGPGCF